MKGLIFSILASLTAGIHIFSLKLLSEYNNTYLLLLLIATTMLLSRYFIYAAMKYSDNPSIVHLILNLSVFVTFFGSIFLLKMKKFDIRVFIIGIFFILGGLFFVHKSYIV
jgi:drug/metabolite transporter (DMT)-like permease